jgi:hypothetical protein
MKKLLSNFFLTSLVFISRLSMLPANVSPLGSFGFFGKKWIWYFSSILAFDALVGGFYQGFWWTYAGFLVYPLFGYLSRAKVSRQLMLLPAASMAFFLLSNFGVFLAWYEFSLQGFLTCYALALPFYSRTLLGDLFFGYGFMAVRYLVKQHRLSLRVFPL